MQGISNLTPLIGASLALDINEPSTTQAHPLGTKIIVYDAAFGWQELIYAKSAAAQKVGELVKLSWTITSGAVVVTATACDTSVAQGKPVAAAKTAFSAANQFGWYVIGGIAPVAGDSSLAADAAVFVHAAGRIGATGVGKQLVGINVIAASTTTNVKTAQVTSGTYTIRVPDTSGWFIGMPLTGTGMGSSAKITHIASDGTVTVDVAATATGQVSVTGTYNDSTVYWSVCLLSAPASIV